MDSRRKSKSQSLSSRLRERVRSTLLEPGRSRGTETGGGTDGAGGSARDPEAPGNLFHCSQCGVVYIGAEKQVCSQCDADLEQVRSTLACNR